MKLKPEYEIKDVKVDALKRKLKIIKKGSGGKGQNCLCYEYFFRAPVTIYGYYKQKSETKKRKRLALELLMQQALNLGLIDTNLGLMEKSENGN